MALSNLHTNWINGSYTADRDAQIKQLENAPLNKDKTTDLNAHADTVGNSIAVGYGYDLKKNLSTLKTDLAGYVTASSDLDKVYNLVNDYFNNGNPNGYTLPKLATEINKYFNFGTETSASNLLVATINKKETLLDSYLGYTMPQSNERLALVDLVYNAGKSMFKVTVNGVEQDSKLTQAIKNDNRAEAWFEIRYNSNGGSSESQGIANRRYSESDLFSLYDNASSITEAEAKEIMRMWTIHQDEITDYEQTYSPSTSGTNNITNNILPAYSYLVTNFASGTTIDGQVIVGKGLQSYSYKPDEKDPDDRILGTGQNDLIFGEKGNDVLNGGAGNDVIYGGDGNDIMYGGTGNDYMEGGAGDDIYIINSGDGTDTIEDKEGSNTVIFNGQIIKLLIKQTDGSYKTPDGAFTAAIVGADLVLTDITTGQKLTLNQNFQEGDFGIQLIDDSDYANNLSNQTINLNDGGDKNTAITLASGINYTVNGGSSFRPLQSVI